MVAPPYTITGEEIHTVVETLRQGIEQVERSQDP
jgi:adenosylmethionine-8-amino-7-oxononanoate aminotransferase